MKFAVGVYAAAASLAAAQNIATYCVPESNGVCFSFHVPSSASSGNGDIFMQIVAPTTLPWVGLGQSPEGTMVGSNLFVVYPSQNGSNVTVSPRTGYGHFPPKANSSAKITVLSGSGVSDGKMVANVQCSNCNSWSAGEMSFSDSKAMWIYGYGMATGKSIHNNSQAAAISFHDGYGSFEVNLPDATGGDADVSNPFAGRAIPTASTKDSTKQVFYNDVLLTLKQNKVRLAHGVIASLAFALLFPVASILMRLGAFGAKNTWKVHASIQMFGYVMVIAVMGLGIWLARGLRVLNIPHVGIGLTATSGVLLLPFLGWAQHSGFVKSGKRTIWGYVHAYLGRALVILGIINFGLGIQYSAQYMPDAVRKGEIAYGVIAGLIALTWLGIVAVTAVTRRRTAKRRDSDVSQAEKTLQLSDSEKSRA